jgi:hypothetical protein
MHKTLTRALATLSATLAVAGFAVAGAGPALAAPTSQATTSYTIPSGIVSPCAAASGDHATCAALVNTRDGRARTETAAVTPEATSPSSSDLTPTDLREAYDLQAPYAGSLQTVAVVTAYDDADAESDLATYRSEYSITPCTTANGCFSKVNETGGTSYPGTSAGWDVADAESLDMISAICPNCHILLVEATADDITDLGTAENEAVTLGAKFIDNDWVLPEAGLGTSETTYDSEYFDHPGVAITAPAGDTGYGTINYPAASQYVTAVGGTTLTADTTSTQRGYTETAWSGTSSGCSAYEPKPSWQTDTGCTTRTLNDVAADADPDGSPVAFYDTPTEGGWDGGGGTLVAAAIIAATYALAGTPAAGTYPAEYPYEYPGGDYTTPGDAYTSSDGLNNITSGSTGTCSPTYLCTAGTGYNGPTGVGTPSSVMSFNSTGGMHGPFIRGTGDLCIDDANDSDTAGNKIQVWDCLGDEAQAWVAQSSGILEHDSDCLDAAGNGTAVGTLIELESCDGATGEQWVPLAFRELYNPHSGLCVDDTDTTEGTQLTLGTCATTNPESWDLPYTDPTASGEITSQITSGECLDNYTGGDTDGNKVDIWTCNGGTDSQEWSVEADGTLQIAGGCLTPTDDDTANGTLLEWYSCDGDVAQHWVDRSDGTLLNLLSGTCIDDPDAVTTNGTQQQIYTCNGNIQQSWNLP